MLEDLRMEATPADDLARPAPPLRGGRRIASPKGEHRRPPAFFLRHFGVFFLFGLSRCMRSRQHGYVQRGIDCAEMPPGADASCI